MEKNENYSGFIDTFLSKLKEQSFVIILMLGGLYYQGVLYQNQAAEQKLLFENQLKSYKETIEEQRKLIDDKQKYVDEQHAKEIERLDKRTEYLTIQRDKYVEDLIQTSRSGSFK
jgi:uncharacterized protein HemX